MNKDVTQLVMAKYHIQEKEKEKARIQRDIDELWYTLKRMCHHPTTITDSQYYPGGYDYVSSVVVTVKCTLCEKVLESYDDPKHKGRHG